MKHLVAFSCVEGFSISIVSASVHVWEKETERSGGLVHFCGSACLSYCFCKYESLLRMSGDHLKIFATRSDCEFGWVS